MTGPVAAYLGATAIGALVGLSELLSRYSWSVRSIVGSWSGWAYLLVNGAASLVAYQIVLDWGLAAGLEGKPEAYRVVISAIVAMAVLRSAVVTIKMGDRDVGLGLVTILEIFLRRAERTLDQRMTLDKWNHVGRRVDGLTYDATRGFLVSVAQGALASMTPAEHDSFQRNVERIDAMETDGDTKLRFLAMAISDRLGDDFFSAIATDASQRFGTEVKRELQTVERTRKKLAQLLSSIEQTREAE